MCLRNRLLRSDLDFRKSSFAFWVDYGGWRGKSKGRPGISFYNKLGLRDQKMMVAHNVVGMNIVRIINSGCILEVEPMVSYGLDVEFEERKNTK